MNYVPLWIKTDYSILSSLVKIDDLINKLKELSITSCAIVDDNLYGVMEFYTKCINNDIKPIIGLEIDVGYKVLLYAKNYSGYQNLCNIDTIKSKGLLNIETLSKYLNDVLIVLPYINKDKKSVFEKYEENIFIGYTTDEERENITGNKVYVKKVLSLEEKKEKYLKILYKIGDKEFNLNDVSLEDSLDTSDKKTTVYFANLCNVKIEKQNDLLPVYVDNAYEYLTKLCIMGLKKRLLNNVSQKYVDRLKYELSVINNMGFCNYFLVVWDYVKYAKKNNILIGLRGSAASSLVSYTLGITDVDPLKYNLLFERFLNPERVTMPDIDIDFDAEKREDVINYVMNKYGTDKTSGIITFSNLLAKQVIRDVSKVFSVSQYKVDNLVNNFDDKKSLKEQLNNALVKDILRKDETLRKVYDVSLNLEGLKRHFSQHAAGIIISNKKLSNYVPLLKVDNGYLCGYTMNYIEDLGLLKMDFLGLKNLSLISNIVSKIENFSYNDIPLDDKEVFKLFQSGNLNGIFQFESAGMRKFMEELKPTHINDLIAANALFRPGPIDNIPLFIKRKNNKEKIDYIDDNLKDILSETYGIIVYQEQIMQIASIMAGFSFGKADILRRAMSKKKEAVLVSMKEDFIKGSINKGYDKDVANKVYDMILKFANYGFNKAHSVSYAIMAYKMAYLKVHYTSLFMMEELNNSIGVVSKIRALIDECKMLNIKVIKPSINSSSYKFSMNGNKIEYSLAALKGIGTLICKQIENERCENGPFKSYLDVIKRLYKLGDSIINTLILSGCLDEFGITRKTMIENLKEAFNYAELCENLDDSLVIEPELKNYDEYDNIFLASTEKEIYGLYLSNHPTNMYINEKSITTNKLSNYFDKTIDMVLYFESKREISTKKNDKMMFINASDLYGNIDLVVFPKTYERFFGIKVPGIYKVNGRVEKRFSKYQIIVNNIFSIIK